MEFVHQNCKIAVAGLGYVGLSLAVLLAQHHSVTAVDVVPEKVNLVSARRSPIRDAELEFYLKEKKLDLTATLDGAAAYRDADVIIVATPTDYDSQRNFFDTSAVEQVISLALSVQPDALIVIKSTIPVGYTAQVREKFHHARILFSPEFLREGHALADNLRPSRIIVGGENENDALMEDARRFASLLAEGALREMSPCFSWARRKRRP